MTLNDFKNANLACKYICVSCDFNSNNNYDYKKHIATQKHKHRINDYFSDKKTHENVYKCVCGKIYKYKQGLSNHKKKCCNKVGEILTPPHIQTEPNYTELIMKLINENQELRNTVLLENQEFKFVSLPLGKAVSNVSKLTGCETGRKRFAADAPLPPRRVLLVLVSVLVIGRVDGEEAGRSIRFLTRRVRTGVGKFTSVNENILRVSGLTRSSPSFNKEDCDLGVLLMESSSLSLLEVVILVVS